MSFWRLLLLFLVLLSDSAIAAPTTKVLQAQVDRGTAALEQGRYDEAIQLLEDAYAQLKDPDPLLLLNIGQAHRKASHTQPAIDAFERFLQAQPDSPYRPKVEKYLSQLRAPQTPTPAPPPPTLLPQPPPIVVNQPPPQLALTAPPAPTPPKPIYKRAWFWGVIGGVVASAAIAGAVGGTLASHSSTINGVNIIPATWTPIQ